MEWTVEERDSFTDYWVKEYAWNTNTKIIVRYHKHISGFHKHCAYSVSSTPNLFAILQQHELEENVFFAHNSLLTNSITRVDELVKVIQKAVEKMSNYSQMTVYVSEKELADYDQHKIINGWFEPSEGYIPLIIETNELSYAMQANPGGSILKGGWTKEKESALYDNF